MPSFYQVTLAAALLAVSAAAPTKSSTFQVVQVAKNPGFLKSGPHVMAATYLKFNKEMPAEVAAAAATTTGSVVATPEQYDSEYLCPVTIGGETLTLDFDTGSSDLYVPVLPENIFPVHDS